MGRTFLRPLLGLLACYSFLICQSLQGIWKSGTRRWIRLRVPDFEISWSALT